MDKHAVCMYIVFRGTRTHLYPPTHDYTACKRQAPSPPGENLPIHCVSNSARHSQPGRGVIVWVLLDLLGVHEQAPGYGGSTHSLHGIWAYTVSNANAHCQRPPPISHLIVTAGQEPSCGRRRKRRGWRWLNRNATREIPLAGIQYIGYTSSRG